MNTSSSDNPFLSQIADLEAGGIPPDIPGFLTQQIVCSALLGLSFFCVVISMAVRWKKGSLWFFRLTDVEEGRLITPNSVIAWLGTSLIYLIMVQFYLWTPSLALDSLVWYPLFVGRWCISQSTIVSTLTSKTRGSTGRFDLGRYPKTLNTLFVLIPVALLLSVGPISVISSLTYDKVNILYYELDDLLRATSDMFDAAVAAGADPFAATAANSDLIASLTDTSNAVGNDSAFYILANWIIWTVFSVIELVVFVAASVAYIKNLWLSIGKLKSETATNSKMKSLNGAVSSLIAQSVVTAIIGSCFLTVSAYLIDPNSNTQVASVIINWIYTGFSLVSYILILLRSFTITLSISPKSGAAVASSSHLTSHSRSGLNKPHTPFPSVVTVLRNQKGEYCYDIELGGKDRAASNINGGIERESSERDDPWTD